MTGSGARRGTSVVVSVPLLKRLNLIPAVRAASLAESSCWPEQSMLAGRDIPLSALDPDRVAMAGPALVVLLVAAIDRVVRPVWLRWSVYGLAVIYTALNVALVHVLSSPMTWPMLRAARGTLADLRSSTI